MVLHSMRVSGDSLDVELNLLSVNVRAYQMQALMSSGNPAEVSRN